MKIVPVIMAGGSGTRLWPLSRASYPKQFLAFNSDTDTLFQLTLKRLQVLNVAPPIIVCNEEHRFLVAEQLRQLGISNAHILLEQKSRNTAPAITMAALFAEQLYGGECCLLVFAADHYFEDKSDLKNAINNGIEVAQQGYLVTFGIEPTAPETGYGYIKAGEKLKMKNAYLVDAFVEKPNITTARQYLEKNNYFWNSGNFIFMSATFLAAIQKHQEQVYESCKHSISTRSSDFDFIRADENKLKDCPAISIDYAVMEKADNIAVITLNSKWQDLGSWSSLAELGNKDNNNNTHIGTVYSLESKHNYINATNRMVATIGVSNLVVVETADAILIADKSKTQDVKHIVEALKKEDKPEATRHLKTYRPWGAYECVDSGDRYQVKRITVNPGAKLSTQMHYHRAEHWVVVSGTAKVTRGDETFIVSENQSTYIPVGEIHALENPGKVPLELIEVQSGAYLGEDDIVRMADKYGRS